MYTILLHAGTGYQIYFLIFSFPLLTDGAVLFLCRPTSLRSIKENCWTELKIIVYASRNMMHHE